MDDGAAGQDQTRVCRVHPEAASGGGAVHIHPLRNGRSQLLLRMRPESRDTYQPSWLEADL